MSFRKFGNKLPNFRNDKTSLLEFELFRTHIIHFYLPDPVSPWQPSPGYRNRLRLIDRTHLFFDLQNQHRIGRWTRRPGRIPRWLAVKRLAARWRDGPKSSPPTAFPAWQPEIWPTHNDRRRAACPSICRCLPVILNGICCEHSGFHPLKAFLQEPTGATEIQADEAFTALPKARPIA